MLIAGTNIKLNISLSKDGIPLDLTNIIDAKIRLQSPSLVQTDIPITITDIENGFGKEASSYYEKHNSPEITTKQFTQLLEVMKKNPEPDQNVLAEELIK